MSRFIVGYKANRDHEMKNASTYERNLEIKGLFASKGDAFLQTIRGNYVEVYLILRDGVFHSAQLWFDSRFTITW
jgi:hypothetical protein